MIQEYKYIKNDSGFFLTDSSAFSDDVCVKFSLSIPRTVGATDVRLRLLDDKGKMNSYIFLSWTALDRGNDIYSVELCTRDFGVGLYWHDYLVYSEGREISVFDDNSTKRQLLIYSKNFKTPAPVNGIIYHIFVDRFFSSGKSPQKNNVIINNDWKNGIPQYADYPGANLKNNMFFGGDLYGVIEKLDYIASLGTSYIYLSPIFEATSNHKYDTGDYLKVDSMFGGDDALFELIKEAEKRDIKIIIDGVFNHTGDDSVYFNKYRNYDSIGAYNSKSSKYFSWYSWEDYDNNPESYRCWWNIKILPKVDTDNHLFRNFIFGKNGVIEKWFNMGVGGIRLDVADELSDDFLKELRQKVKSINPRAVIIGEVWEDATNKIAYGKRREYFWGLELDSVMNYPLRQAIIDYIKGGDDSGFLRTCEAIYTHYPKQVCNGLMNMLGTHDTERVITVLSGPTAIGLSNRALAEKKLTKQERCIGAKRQILAYMLLASMPGIPSVFYGDETGMEGYHDPFCRRPFNWQNVTDAPDDVYSNDILTMYRKIGMIRKKEAIFVSGKLSIPYCSRDIVAVLRYNDAGEGILAIVNRGEEDHKIYSDFKFKDMLDHETLSDPIIPAGNGKLLKIIGSDISPENFRFDIQ